MSPSPSRSRPQTEGGFTLVEALAALTVLAVCLSAIGMLAAGSLRSGASFEHHVDAIETMRTVMTGLPGRNELTNGDLAGVTNGKRWRIAARPYAEAAPDQGAPRTWMAQAVAVTLRSANGSVVEIDTIRLRAP